MASSTESMYHRYCRRISVWHVVVAMGITYLAVILRYQAWIHRTPRHSCTSYHVDEDGPPMGILGGDEAFKYQQGWSIQDDPGLLKYIKQQWIHGPSQENYNLEDNKIDRDASQFGQSKFVDEQLLNKRTDGFFVECGAANGETFSNTLLMERMRGWTGLLVEANPYYYRELLGKRRNSYSINACLSVSNHTDRLKFQPAGLFGGLANSMDETHLRAVSGHTESVQAQCFNLYSILLALGQTHVDYLSLDVEGPEIEILQTIPLERLRVDLISVEYRLSDNVHINETGSLMKLETARKFFKQTGVYDEVGILPYGTHDNPTGTDGKGLDVFFRRKDWQRT